MRHTHTPLLTSNMCDIKADYEPVNKPEGCRQHLKWQIKKEWEIQTHEKAEELNDEVAW